jgi:Cu2+-exporting ATPase
MTSDPKTTVARHAMANDHGPASNAHVDHKMSDMHGSHDRHAGHSVAMFRNKFWLSLFLTIPVVFCYGGLVFIRGAGGELADRKPGMMTLIGLAIIVAFGTSVAVRSVHSPPCSRTPLNA